MRISVTALLAATALVSASANAATSEQVNKRAEDLLSKMTLEEKIDYIGGTGMGIRAIERLGIPAIMMSDGPMGCRCYGEAACFPAGIALASTWDTGMAQEIGVALGRECRARGVHILLAPGVNIHRSPLCGRNFEYLGEDPYLASTMVAPLIQGLQSQEVFATVKHFACNNQEWDRNGISSEVDERTLREIYLPAFESAVHEGNTRCLMTSYNLVNGVHASQHDELVNQILKKEWGFDGIVMSDWGGTHDAVGAANGGEDLEMPDGAFMNRANLIPAIKDGRVKESTIDEKVRRILRTIIAAGFLDRPQLRTDIPKDDPASRRVALKGAREGTVLLKNEGNILPIDRTKIKSVAVVGPNADPAVYCAGGSAFTTTYRSTSVADGIKGLVGDNVEFYRPITDLGFAGPVKMEVFGNQKLEGEPAYTGDIEKIDFDWGNTPAPGVARNFDFSVRWQGKIHVETAGKYTLTTRSDDGIRLFVDGKTIVNDWTNHGVTLTTNTVDLSAGDHEVRVEYFQGGGMAIAYFGWMAASAGAEELEKLKKFDLVVYCAGFNQNSEGEGFDRHFELPDGQVETIRNIAKVNPRVVVALNSGGCVSWDGWLDEVPAVLQTWYSGEETGRATAEIIFGLVNPSGKIAATFGKRWEDYPSAPYYKVNDNMKTPYAEGIFVGYRGFDKNKVEPQFPFGFGLSYTTFGFSDLRVETKGGGVGRTVEVSCDVTNTGKIAGAEVAQLYVTDEKCSEPRPVRELKGFSRVQLMPGETKRVTFQLTEKSLSFYDVKAHSWKAEPGAFRVAVGSSSRDLPLSGEFVW